jgi:hypothetical protein
VIALPLLSVPFLRPSQTFAPIARFCPDAMAEATPKIRIVCLSPLVSRLRAFLTAALLPVPSNCWQLSRSVALHASSSLSATLLLHHTPCPAPIVQHTRTAILDEGRRVELVRGDISNLR